MAVGTLMLKTSQLCDLLSSMAAMAALAGVPFALGSGVPAGPAPGSIPWTTMEIAWPRFESNHTVAAWPGCGSCLSSSSPAASSTTSCTID